MKRLVLFIITITIFLVLLSMIDLQDAAAAAAKANLWLLAFAAFISLIFPVLCAWRWYVLCRLLNTPLGFWESVKIIMAAWPLGAVTPAKSGDLIKVIYLQNRFPISLTGGIVLAERVVDVFVLGIFALVFGWWMNVEAGIYTGILVIMGILCFFLTVYSPWIDLIPAAFRDKARNVAMASRLMSSHPIALLWILLITGINWFLSVYQTWICYLALNTEVPFLLVAAAIPVAIFVGLLPITPAGMGTREAAIMMLFADYASNEVNLSVGILYSIYGYWFLSLLGIPFMRSALSGSFEHISRQKLVNKIYNK